MRKNLPKSWFQKICKIHIFPHYIYTCSNIELFIYCKRYWPQLHSMCILLFKLCSSDTNMNIRNYTNWEIKYTICETSSFHPLRPLHPVLFRTHPLPVLKQPPEQVSIPDSSIIPFTGLAVKRSSSLAAALFHPVRFSSCGNRSHSIQYAYK